MTHITFLQSFVDLTKHAEIKQWQNYEGCLCFAKNWRHKLNCSADIFNSLICTCSAALEKSFPSLSASKRLCFCSKRPPSPTPSECNLSFYPPLHYHLSNWQQLYPRLYNSLTLSSPAGQPELSPQLYPDGRQKSAVWWISAALCGHSSAEQSLLVVPPAAVMTCTHPVKIQFILES